MRHPMPNTDDTVTIYDVARESGVSMATVSRVVNGNKNVREVTRKKVQAVIDRLDYRPNQVARGLASRKTTTVGVLLPNLSNSYFASLAQGVEDIAGMYNYDVIIANSDDSEEKEIKLINSLLARQVDGIIYMGYRISDRVRNEFSRTRTPIVLAGTVDGKGDLPSVNVDYKEAATEAVKLLTKNSKKIAFVSGPLSDTINERDRLEGYKAALKSKKIKFTDKLVFEADYKYDEGYDLAEKVKKSGATAAYVADDELALGLLNGLADAGVKIPKDFEILTSNDSQLAKYARPNLSSVTLPVYDLGAIAMRLLTKIMLKEEVDERQVVLDYKITSRQSTK